jgi:guanylate kinase
MRGLRWGKITPTDVDCAVEFANKCFIFVEYKYGDKEIDTGQFLFYTRLVSNLWTIPIPAILIHASHNQPVQCDIDAANAKVVKTWTRNHWETGWAGKTVEQTIDAFLNIYHPAALFL